MQQTGRTVSPDRFPQPLRLNFSPTVLRSVISMDVTVHGGFAVPRVEPAASGGGLGTERTQNFTFGRQSGTFAMVRMITTEAMPVVTRVEITRVQYADGTEWHSAPGNTCTVQPSLYVELVAGR
jgi:hypothetical protein